ncbi:hypothetical protein CDD80_1932 [Ophiocordyceps camponoti-rufipedis]|uniref:SMP-30/Gluconolactonase/LRE-like region domain-containing protein n=1 Tax=Ophiocordyceps camponoti-rufipedis TaxID=2004952 RepID=A0A2C5Z7G0_9HYPO|nr:hypothetical protein CDD80_1932 [Ophiocordyceps camponoti-rufipedis]
MATLATTQFGFASIAFDTFQAADMSSVNISAVFGVDLTAAATDALYFAKLPAPAIELRSYHNDFANVLGPDASARMVWDVDWEAFHEAGVYHRPSNSLYISSNFKSLDDPINMTIVSLDSDDYPFRSVRIAGLAMPNGGTTYRLPGINWPGPSRTQVYCDEGDFEHYSQLVVLDPSTGVSWPILTSYLGRNFSSINDVRQHPVTGDLWFTDADYGYFQHFRPKPTISKHVYRFEPQSGRVQVVADGFVQPNGIEFSPDQKTLYVSDTGSQQFDVVPGQPSTIYAYDIVGKRRLMNRRVFAYLDSGFPDGMHCDTEGNLWVAGGDGVHIFNIHGELLGKIYIGETSNNFAFAPGKVFIFSNHRLWVVENINALGREVCDDFDLEHRVCRKR